MKSGIYKILNTKNNKYYVGSAVHLISRLNTHKSNLRKNKHPNKHIQASYNKYSEWNFEFVIIEYCEKEKLLEREQYYIDTLNPEYNIRKIAKSNLGVNFGKQTIEHIEKRVSKFRNKKRSLETLIIMSNVQKGKITSEETKNKISRSLLGRSRPEEVKLKIGKTNSLPEKWPHKDKSNCRCRECLDKKNYFRYYKPIKFVMVENV